MKKILLLVFLFVLGKMSYSQGYPLTQNLGSDSTIVVSKGALQSRLVPIVITDTNAANAQRLKSYPGAQLYTTAGDFYIRNSNATKWILVSSGSSGSVNIYTADGTLTGNRTLTGANNNLTFTGLNKFSVSTDTTLFNTNTFGIKGVGGVLNVEGTAAGTTSSLTLKTASDGNWTISTGQVNFNSGDLRFYDNDNGANRMIIKPSGNVGIGTETPDSLLTVNGGVYVGGGIRAPGLPTALGTKALRINAQGQISVADTTLGGGTVISVGTNNGSGITGGPITVSGTLAIDTTNVIATKSSVTGGLAGKLNISDTASMLSPYLRKADTTAMLAPYLRAIDTASLSNRINLKLNISDTASMLGNYLNNVGYGLSKVGQVASADSATLSAYYLRRKDSLTTTNPLGYVTKKILADTAAAIRSSDAGGTVTSVATNNGTGITGGTITTSGTLAIDTLLVSTRAWRQKGVDSVAALANTKISGSLISGYLTKATGTNTLGNSIMQDNGSTINLAGGMIATGSLEGSGIRANDVIQFQNINTSSSLTGYTTLQADSTNKTFRFNFGDGVRIAEFKYAASSYTYNLPSSNGTLALTSDLTGGTVTSVATNNGTGITGGTITTSGTLAIDTTVISTRAWRQKGIDSVASLITGSYVPLSRTLTINGTSFDLSANRTWNVGTVTTAAASGGGQVAFFNGSTVITSVTGLYFDGTNKLAIGSSSPDSMLSVTQGAHIQRGVRLSGLPTAPGTRSLRIDANGTLSVSDTLANGMSGSGTPNYIPKFTSSSAIGNSVIYEASGNVGIGTTSPIAFTGYTSVAANGTSGGAFVTMANGTSALRVISSTTDAAIWEPRNSPILFGVNNAEQMRLTSTGLGIGTSSPAYKLDVSGDARLLSSSSPSLFISNTSTNGKNYRLVSKDDGLFVIQQTGIADLLFLNTSGNLGLGVTPSAWSGVTAIQIGSASGLSLFGYSGTGSEIASNTYFNGTNYAYATTATATKYVLSSGQHRWYIAPSGTQDATISFTQAMTLDASGRLGIGTTSPSTRLHVLANDGLNEGLAATIIRQGGSAGNNGLLVDVTNTVGQYVADYRINNSSVMRLDASGNLGIGTTSPGAILHTLSSSANGGIIATTSATSLYTEYRYNTTSVSGYIGNGNGIVTGGGAGNFGIRAETDLLFAAGGNAERMRITSGGNVGIGTTSPSNILSIVANTNSGSGSTYPLTSISNTLATQGDGSSTFNFAGQLIQSGNGAVQFYQSTSYASGTWEPQALLNVATNHPLIIRTNNTERMRITSGGEVLINTTSDAGDYKLQVSGNVYASGTAVFTGFNSSYYNENILAIGNATYNPKIGLASTSGYRWNTRIKDVGGNGEYVIRYEEGSLDALTINRSGNVGIGTTSPNYKLDVNGVIVGGDGTIRTAISYAAGGVIGTLTNHDLQLYTNGSEKMRITSGGEVYIAGTTDQGAYNLQVNGTGVWGAGAYVDGSDSAVKKNIQPLGSSLDLIKQMNPVTFEYQPFYSKDTTTQTGFIAQELQQVLSDKVYKNGIVKEGGQYLGVAYQHLIPLLVKAIQEQQTQIDQLKSQLNNR